MCNTYHIESTRGDTITLQFSTAGDYTASTFQIQVRTSPDAASTTLNLTEGSGITKTYSGGSTVIIATITAVQCAALDPDIIYCYDVTVTTGSTVKTWFKGTISLEADTTRP